MKRCLHPAVLVAAAMAGAVPLAAHGQQVSALPGLAPGASLLTVSAEGRTTHAPDLAVFTAGVISQGKTASEALSANAADMNRVIAALRRSGIADRDVQTSNLSLNPVYAPQRTLPDGSITPAQPTIIGYQANNTVNVRQRKLADYGKVIDTLVTAGANQVNGPSFELDNPAPAQDEARTAAVRQARALAELYARAAALRVSRIVSISESAGWSPPQPVMYRTAANSAPPAPSPVQAGELQVNVNVTMQFELVP